MECGTNATNILVYCQPICLKILKILKKFKNKKVIFINFEFLKATLTTL